MLRSNYLTTKGDHKSSLIKQGGWVMELGTFDTLEIKERLLQSNEEFRRLAQKHTNYDEQLEKLLHKSYLSEEEKIEEVNLKKMKLHVKDQMQVMIQKYRQQAAKHTGPSK